MLRIILLVAFYLITFNINAQGILGKNYLVNTRILTTEDGLSHNQINRIFKDSKGIMWLGTEFGLNRYDGYEFKWFTKEKNGLEDNQIKNIIEDDEGWLWIFNLDDKRFFPKVFMLNFIHSETYEVLTFEEKFKTPPFKIDEIKSFLMLDNRMLLFHLKNGKNYQYSSKEGFVQIFKDKQFRPIKALKNDEFWAQINNNLIQTNITGEILKSLPLSEGFTVAYLETDAKGRNWEGWLKIDENGVEGVGGSHFYLRDENGLRDVKDVLPGFTPTNENKQYLPAKISHTAFYMYYNPVQEQIWMRTSKYFQMVDKDLKITFEGEFLGDARMIRSNLFWDENNTLWMGTRDGLKIIEIKESLFQRYFFDDKPKGKYSTRGITKVGDYLMVNGEPNKAINLKTNQAYKFPNPLPSNVRELRNFNKTSHWPSYLDEQNNYWTAGAEVYRIEVETGKILESLPVIDSLKGRIFTLIKEDDGTWWYNIWYKYLFYYNPKTHDKPQLFNLNNGIERWKKGISSHLYDDKKQDCIWMSNERGLFQIDKEKGIIGDYWNDGKGQFFLPANSFYQVYKDKDDVFWIATGNGGLLRVESDYFYKKDIKYTDAVRQFSRADGLPSNAIYSIREDDNNYLWLGTGNGLVQFNKATFEFRTYLPEHGTTHKEFNRLSSHKTKNGEMYFGGMNGVTGFNPKDFYALPDYDIPLVFSEVRALKDGKDLVENITDEVLKNGKIKLAYRDKFLEFKFSLQDYFYSDKIKYTYNIENYNEEWTAIKGNTLQLGKLPIGKYILKVKAQGFDNRYSKNELSLPITVKPPFYFTWWFISLAITMIALGLWQAYLFRTRQLFESKRQLEELVAERTKQIEKDKEIIETQAKELQELDKVKSRFFANVSHELRTPLTLILSPAKSMLNSNDLSNKNFTYASVIQQNAKNLLKRINEILDLTKLDAKQLEVKQQPTSFYPFIKRLVSTFESLTQQKEIQLFFDYQTDKSLQILIDQTKMEHVFNNYLSNAIKYTPKNGVIEAIIKEENNELQLIVKDTGQGIHPDDLPKVFDRFYQAKYTKSASGTGIGLALCRELAQIMNGKVWVESTVGEGSLFYFQFPYKEVMGTATTLEVEVKSNIQNNESINKKLTTLIDENPLTQTQPTILLVEDNFQLRNYIQLVLQDDYQIITAENGKIALEQLSTATCQLVISDIMMPEMDGFELLNHLKSNEKTQSIPVIMLTARASVETKLEALRIGVDDYIVKPFDELVLKARIKNLLENSQQRIQFQQADLPNTAPSKKATAPKPINAKWLKEVEGLILTEMTNRQFNLDFLAERMVLSKRQLQRKIKQNSGLSANNYVRIIRLQKARELLEKGDLQTVSEASYAVGFEDPHYFSTIFEKEFGVRPKSLLKE